jgi:hypothetical protein
MAKDKKMKKSTLAIILALIPVLGGIITVLFTDVIDWNPEPAPVPEPTPVPEPVPSQTPTPLGVQFNNAVLEDSQSIGFFVQNYGDNATLISEVKLIVREPIIQELTTEESTSGLTHFSAAYHVEPSHDYTELKIQQRASIKDGEEVELGISQQVGASGSGEDTDYFVIRMDPSYFIVNQENVKVTLKLIPQLLIGKEWVEVEREDFKCIEYSFIK